MERSGMTPMAQALPGGGGIGHSVAGAAGTQCWGFSFAPQTASVGVIFATLVEPQAQRAVAFVDRERT